MSFFRNLFSRRSNRLEKLSPPELDKGDILPPPPSIKWWQVLSYPPLIIGILIVVGLIAVVWFAPSWSSYDPYLITQSQRPYYDSSIQKLIKPPFPMSPEFPFGSDQWGNDLLTLVLYGARMTLIVGLYIMIARVLLGTILGLISGWYEGSVIDKTINGVGTVLGSVPVLLSSIVLIYALDIYKGAWVFVAALSLLGWFEINQVVRGEVLRIKQTGYVEAARAVGLSNLQIIVRHILPNVTAYLIVVSVLEMGAVLLLLAELAFLGVFIGGGSRYVDDPFSSRGVVLLREIPEWGAMVAQGVRYIRPHPNMVLVPGFAFFISIVGVNALGEGLRWLFTRWPFSTAGLLKKRTVFAVIALIVVSSIILKQTGPLASFEKVSREITAETLQARTNTLMQIQAESPNDAGEAVAEYLAEQMKEYEIGQGYRSGLHASYHYDYETVVTPLLSTPELASVSTSGQLLETFTHQTDFVLAPDQPMQDVSMQAGVVLANPQSENTEWSFDGKIVMTTEALAPVNYSQFVAAHGGVGLLLVADETLLNCSLETANMPVQITYYDIRLLGEFSIPRLMPIEGEPQFIPTLHLTQDAASRLLGSSSLSLDVFESSDWSLMDLEVDISIDLKFGEGEQIKVHNAFGYVGGYDVDKAHETVLVYAPYDSSTGSADDMLSAAIMLEMMKAWHENKLDPRRSLMFVAWDRAKLGTPGAQVFLDERNNYRLLTPKVPAADAKPIMILDLSVYDSQDGDFLVTSSSDAVLERLLSDAASEFGASSAVERSATCQTDVSVFIPSVSLLPDNAGDTSPQFAETFARTVSLMVLKVLRLPNY